MRRFPALFSRARTRTREAIIFEDDTLTASMYKMLLEREGFAAKIYDDNEACRREVRAHHPDLLICDVMNDGGTSGLNLIESICEDLGDQVPAVIVATALQTHQIRNHPALRRVRNLRTMMKPFDIDVMLNTITQLL